MSLYKIRPLSPDIYLGKTIGDNTLARIAHVNQLVDQINTLLEGYQTIALTVKTITAAHTLELSDAGCFLNIDIATPNDLTIPANDDVPFPIGTQIFIAEYGVGQVTIVGDTGVTVNSANGKLKTAAQYSGASLIKIAEDEWYAFGDLSL